MIEENIKTYGQQEHVENKKTISLRIELDEDVLKKITIIAPLKGIEGKKQEIVSKIIDLAVNHYYKEVTVPELQKLTGME